MHKLLLGACAVGILTSVFSTFATESPLLLMGAAVWIGVACGLAVWLAILLARTRRARDASRARDSVRVAFTALIVAAGAWLILPELPTAGLFAVIGASTATIAWAFIKTAKPLPSCTPLSAGAWRHDVRF